MEAQFKVTVNLELNCDQAKKFIAFLEGIDPGVEENKRRREIVKVFEDRIKKEKRHTKTKKCQKCGKEFKPISNAQFYCSSECGLKPPKKSKVKSEPIEKTMAEIEENKRRREATPYEFSTI